MYRLDGVTKNPVYQLALQDSTRCLANSLPSSSIHRPGHRHSCDLAYYNFPGSGVGTLLSLKRALMVLKAGCCRGSICKSAGACDTHSVECLAPTLAPCMIWKSSISDVPRKAPLCVALCKQRLLTCLNCGTGSPTLFRTLSVQ